MTLGVIVELYSVLGDSDPQAYQLRLNSAGYIASVIAYYDKEAIVQKGCIVSGVSPIPPVPRPANLTDTKRHLVLHQYCWCLAAHVLVTHIKKVKDPAHISSSSGGRSMSLTECESQLNRVLTALEKLSITFPTLGELFVTYLAPWSAR